MKKIFLFVLFALSAAFGFAAPLGSAFYSADGTKKNSFIRVVDKVSQIEDMSDEDFDDNSAEVIFPVNVYRLQENSSFAKLLEKEIIPQLNSDSLRLVKMFVRGAASPEGPYLNNVMLANRRAKSLYNYVNSRLKYQSTSDPDFNSVPEDYGYLCKLMKDAKDPDYAEVKRITDYYLSLDVHPKKGMSVEQYRIEILKRRLMHYNKGILWKRLLRTYFPKLRSARVIFVFEKVPKEEVKAPQSAIVHKLPAVTPPNPVVVPSQPIDEHRIDEHRRALLSVKSNLLFDFAYMPGYDRFCPIPNVAVEYYPLHGHFTFGASFDCPWWQHYWEHKYFQVRNYQVETRYYLKSGDVEKDPLSERPAFQGWYLKAYAHAGLYDICFDQNRGWEGEGWGAGLGFGYSIPLTREGHWRLELGLQAGYFTTRYDPYQWECPVDPTEQDHIYYYKWTGDSDKFKTRQYRFNWLNVTRVDITLSYDLLYRRIHKKGASFKCHEHY